MGKYIDADKLKSEIERQQRRLILLAHTEQASVRRDCALQNGAYSYILSIIASLQQEQPEVDLEKEIHRYFNPHGMALHLNRRIGNTIFKPEQLLKFARYFAEWGAIHLNARKEE